MKQSNVIKGTLAVVALVAALVVGVAVHMHSVCVLSSCYRPVWREFSFRKSGRF